MGEMADDHYVALSWSHGVGIGGDGGCAPPCDHPAYGGLDLYIQNHTRSRASLYRCKFCRSLIAFVNRKPYNLVDGSDHRCLTERAATKEPT